MNGFILGALVAFLIYKFGDRVMARGIRNKNPGNIRINRRNDWLGVIPRNRNTDGSFEQFKTMEHGVRALAILLINYYHRGHTTVREIVNTYAPPIENNTSAYIEHVAQAANIDPDEHMSRELFIEKLPLIVNTIIKHENGATIPAGQVIAGIDLAKNAKGLA